MSFLPDKKILNRIKELHHKIPKSMRENVMHKEYFNADAKDRANMVLKDRKVPEKAKLEIKKLMDKGAFDMREKQVVNENVTRKINEIITKQIRRDIESGKLPDPRKMTNDPFLKNLRRNFEGKKWR